MIDYCYKMFCSRKFIHYMRKKLQKGIPIFLLAIIAGVFFQFSIDRRPVSEQEFSFIPSTPPFLTDSSSWSDSVLKTLSTKDQIGQLFMAAAYPNQGIKDMKRVTDLIRDHHIGGIIFFQGTPGQVVELVRYYQSISEVPLLIAIDGEWGPSMRIEQTIRYPRQMMLGAINDNELIYQMGRDIGKQLKMLGIHVNFAPVIDVNNNPANPVINSRSFGEDRENVARKGILYMNGMQDEGIIAVAKHFPGHGDTDLDSHYDLPVIMHNAQRLDSIELYPFRALIESGICGVMTAHLSVPNLDTTPNLPSTLSHTIEDSLLKGVMNFKGLVFTDAMTMKGVTKLYEADVSNCLAVLAGNDILLMPEDVGKSINQICKMIEEGRLDSTDIKNRCKKILQAKEWAVLPALKEKKLFDQQLIDSLNSPYFEIVRRQLIEKSITLVENNQEIIPLKNLEKQNIAVVSIGSDSVFEFQQTMALYDNISEFVIRGTEDSAFTANLLDTLQNFNVIVVSLHSDEFRASKQFGINKSLLQMADTILSCYPTILTLFANPYMLSKLKYLKNNLALVVSYENDITTQQLTAQIIFGAIGAQGHLPVSIDHDYHAGRGIESVGGLRLRYLTPLEAGFDYKKLHEIDTIIENAINQHLMPGCQILAAKHGQVFFQKSYGYHDYYEREPVRNTDLYDIASVTKVVASVPAIMYLEEKEMIDLNDHLSRYLPELENTNKNKIRIDDVLLHQAGLQPYIPFYNSTLLPVYPNQKLSSPRYSKQYPIQAGKNFFYNKQLKYKEGYYSREKDEIFSMEIAEGLYQNPSVVDSLLNAIYNSNINKPGTYCYSDLGFILFYRMIESMTGKKYNDFLDSILYAPLGASSLTYLPLEKFEKSRIAPTENDLVFRKQIMQGYVHDQSAAILGGVAGHAGLFSNANDLAKYMQMLLNNGNYGGQQLLDSKLIEKYTSCINCEKGNRRGLGFDKPDPDSTKNGSAFQGISGKSFGHTGFTGTMVWADPATGIIYIFLSNRVYPDAMNNKLLTQNIRTRVQKAIYDAEFK
jgi:beta-N-acetylhexosaminidase